MGRKNYKPSDKLLKPALTHMRETVFGAKAHFEIKDVLDRSERMRDDDGLISGAEDKRRRKAEKRMAATKTPT